MAKCPPGGLLLLNSSGPSISTRDGVGVLDLVFVWALYKSVYTWKWPLHAWTNNVNKNDHISETFRAKFRGGGFRIFRGGAISPAAYLD